MMFIGRCGDCCKICCCVPGDGEGESYIDTTKSRRQCEQAGGTVVECPQLPFCQCVCTPSGEINGIPLAYEPGVDASQVAPVLLGIEPTAASICATFAGTEWRFYGAMQYQCELLGIQVHFLRVIVFAQLWWVFDDGAKTSMVNGNQVNGQNIWDYFFPTVSSATEDGWPCAKNTPLLQSINGWNVMDPNTACILTDPNWFNEFQQLAAKYEGVTVGISCDPYTQSC